MPIIRLPDDHLREHDRHTLHPILGNFHLPVEVPDAPRPSGVQNLSRDGWSEDQCRNTLIRMFSFVPRNYAYSDGLRIIYPELQQYFGDENMDLALGVLQELIECEAPTPFPECVFQRWKYMHLSRRENFSLPHVPHNSTIVAPVIPTRRLLEHRNKEAQETGSTPWPSPGIQSSGVVAHHPAWRIESTTYVSVGGQKSTVWSTPNARVFHERSWDTNHGSGRTKVSSRVIHLSPEATKCYLTSPSTTASTFPAKPMEPRDELHPELRRARDQSRLKHSGSIASFRAVLHSKPSTLRAAGTRLHQATASIVSTVSKHTQDSKRQFFIYRPQYREDETRGSAHIQDIALPPGVRIPNANFARKYQLAPPGEKLPAYLLETLHVQPTLDDIVQTQIKNLRERALALIEVELKAAGDVGLSWAELEQLREETVACFLDAFDGSPTPGLFFDSGLEFNWNAKEGSDLPTPPGFENTRRPVSRDTASVYTTASVVRRAKRAVRRSLHANTSSVDKSPVRESHEEQSSKFKAGQTRGAPSPKKEHHQRSVEQSPISTKQRRGPRDPKRERPSGVLGSHGLLHSPRNSSIDLAMPAVFEWNKTVAEASSQQGYADVDEMATRKGSGASSSVHIVESRDSAVISERPTVNEATKENDLLQPSGKRSANEKKSKNFSRPVPPPLQLSAAGYSGDASVELAEPTGHAKARNTREPNFSLDGACDDHSELSPSPPRDNRYKPPRVPNFPLDGAYDDYSEFSQSPYHDDRYIPSPLSRPVSPLSEPLSPCSQSPSPSPSLSTGAKYNGDFYIHSPHFDKSHSLLIASGSSLVSFTMEPYEHPIPDPLTVRKDSSKVTYHEGMQHRNDKVNHTLHSAVSLAAVAGTPLNPFPERTSSRAATRDFAYELEGMPVPERFREKSPERVHERARQGATQSSTTSTDTPEELYIPDETTGTDRELLRPATYRPPAKLTVNNRSQSAQPADDTVSASQRSLSGKHARHEWTFRDNSQDRAPATAPPLEPMANKLPDIISASAISEIKRQYRDDGSGLMGNFVPIEKPGLAPARPANRPRATTQSKHNDSRHQVGVNLASEKKVKLPPSSFERKGVPAWAKFEPDTPDNRETTWDQFMANAQPSSKSRMSSPALANSGQAATTLELENDKHKRVIPTGIPVEDSVCSTHDNQELSTCYAQNLPGPHFITRKPTELRAPAAVLHEAKPIVQEDTPGRCQQHDAPFTLCSFLHSRTVKHGDHGGGLSRSNSSPTVHQMSRFPEKEHQGVKDVPTALSRRAKILDRYQGHLVSTSRPSSDDFDKVPIHLQDSSAAPVVGRVRGYSSSDNRGHSFGSLKGGRSQSPERRVPQPHGSSYASHTATASGRTRSPVRHDVQYSEDAGSPTPTRHDRSRSTAKDSRSPVQDRNNRSRSNTVRFQGRPVPERKEPHMRQDRQSFDNDQGRLSLESDRGRPSIDRPSTSFSGYPDSLSRTLVDVPEQDEEPRPSARTRSQSSDPAQKKRSRSPMKKLWGKTGFFGEGEDNRSDRRKSVGSKDEPFENASEKPKKPGMMAKLRLKVENVVENTNLNNVFFPNNDKVLKSALLPTTVTGVEQAAVFMEIGVMMHHAANKFISHQASKGRIDINISKKIVDGWKSKGKPPVNEYMYDRETQRFLVSMHANVFEFWGPEAGNSIDVGAVLLCWKCVARDLAEATYCLPDIALLKLLSDVNRIMLLLGAPDKMHHRLWTIHTGCSTIITQAQHIKRDKSEIGRTAQWLPPPTPPMDGPLGKYGGLKLIPDWYNGEDEWK